MMRSMVVGVGLVGVFWVQAACFSEHSQVPTVESVGTEVVPQEAQKFPFTYRVDQETCAQDEVVDIGMILDALCSPPSALAPSEEFEIPVSPLCDIKSDLIIMCDSVTTPREALVCSSSVGNIPGDEGLVRIHLAQTDEGRLPPPKHASTDSPCGSILESLSAELRNVAKLEERSALPITQIRKLESVGLVE